MAIHLQMLGANSSSYREQLQETPEEVAAATGIEFGRLIAIEAGAAEPTGDEVLILADHYQCDFKFFISHERVCNPSSRPRPCIGRMATTSQRPTVEPFRSFLYLSETEAYLMAELGRSGEHFSFTPVGSYVKAHGEAAAHALRNRTRL